MESALLFDSRPSSKALCVFRLFVVIYNSLLAETANRPGDWSGPSENHHHHHISTRQQGNSVVVSRLSITCDSCVAHSPSGDHPTVNKSGTDANHCMHATHVRLHHTSAAAGRGCRSVRAMCPRRKYASTNSCTHLKRCVLPQPPGASRKSSRTASKRLGVRLPERSRRAGQTTASSAGRAVGCHYRRPGPGSAAPPIRAGGIRAIRGGPRSGGGYPDRIRGPGVCSVRSARAACEATAVRGVGGRAAPR